MELQIGAHNSGAIEDIDKEKTHGVTNWRSQQWGLREEIDKGEVTGSYKMEEENLYKLYISENAAVLYICKIECVYDCLYNI